MVAAVRLALLAGVAVSVVLGLGTQGPAGGRLGYLVLLRNLPGFEGLRTPGRLIIWTTLLLALLAAGGVCALVARAGEVAAAPGLPGPATARAGWRCCCRSLLVVARGPRHDTARPGAAGARRTVHGAAPYLVLPTRPIGDMHVMLWSTDRFADVVNGGSGFVPAELAARGGGRATFPDAASVAYLRELGVRTVVVLPDRAAGRRGRTRRPCRSTASASPARCADDAVVFHLDA